MKLDTLVDWYTTLTPATVAGISEIYHEEARFRDPFNDVYGHKAIAGVFEHMFKTTRRPAFHINATQTEGAVAWVSWIFTFFIYGKTLSIEGVTRLDFAADGRVLEHRDYWDALDLLVELPMLGALLRHLRKRLSACKPLAS